MGNWRFGAFPKLPYSTMQQLNLDWILDRIRRFLPDNGTKGQVLTRTKDGAAWVDPEAASGAVSSVNGKTGAVVLTASDVGALPSSYQAPVTSVNGMTGDVVISGGGAVDSVNGQTGEVVLTAADVGALPSSYQAPVSSVNGQTGAVQLSIPDSTSDLTNDSGFVTAAQAAAAAPVQSVNGMTGNVVLDAAESGIGYCKMSDGTLICWGELLNLQKTATSRGNGGIYTAEWTQTVATFAIPFVSKPIVTLTPSGNAYNIVCCALWDSTAITYIEVGRPTSGNISMYINYIAIGRWKE